MRVIILSREKVKNPYVKEIIDIGREIDRRGTISVRYGNRILISTNPELKNLSEDDFVEVVDYNISTDTALIIGYNQPLSSLSLHWMIYRLPDVNAVIHLHECLDFQLRIEQILDVLKSLKEERFISSEILGRISIGRYLKEVLDTIKSI